jgi:hypothetical protein
MRQSDWDILAKHGVTPDNLSVGGWLDLEGCTGLTSLPDNLSVGGSLSLEGCTGLTSLPDNLSVGGWLYLGGCTGLTSLYESNHGYRLDRAGDFYFAGCRRFTADQAIAHWGSPDYPDQKRGAGFVAAVRAEEQARKAMQ